MTTTPARILLVIAAAAVAVLVAVAGAPPATASEFRVLAWNVESNRPDSARVSDPGVIAGQLTELLRTPATRAQIVALSEVAPATIHDYRRAIAAGLDGEVDCVTSASGGFRDSDSLLLAVDTGRFAIEQVIELHRHAGIAGNLNVDDADSAEHGRLRARSPLVARLRDRADGRTFLFVTVHLARGEVALRTDQARMLRAWAADQREPIVAAGDFNFDWEFRTRKGNAAFAEMVKDDVWHWLEPDPLVDSNWADDRRKTDVRSDRYPDSILDFVFVAHGARDWQGHSDVVVRPGDFPDDDTTSDHRPIVATFTPPAP